MFTRHLRGDLAKKGRNPQRIDDFHARLKGADPRFLEGLSKIA
jgi:hypothetical protein